MVIRTKVNKSLQNTTNGGAVLVRFQIIMEFFYFFYFLLFGIFFFEANIP